MVLSMVRWVGKVAVVTGASAGIGAAITEALVENGVKVAGLARRKERLEAFASKLSNKKGKLYPIQADIGTEGDILKAFKWIKENLGPVHILVNNAGFAMPTTLVDGDIEIWRKTFDVNVMGLCIATREAIRDMRANNVDGHIIHINSTELHNLPNINVYPSSKDAVAALAETLRLELMNLKLKIKITNLSPGPVDTEEITEELRKTPAMKEALQKKQILEPEMIADAVIYALSTPPHVQVQQLTVRPVIELSHDVYQY